MQINNTDIQHAFEAFKSGGVILIPSDVCWEVACDATNADALEKLTKLMNIGVGNVTVLVDVSGRIPSYASDVPDIAWDLISVSDKPLTIIYSSAKNLATNLLGADGSVGIRITNEEFSKKLCERFRKPLVSTSANVSGEPSPANFSEVSEVIKEGVDYIVSYRQDDMSKAAPSGIIKLGAGGLVQVIR